MSLLLENKLTNSIMLNLKMTNFRSLECMSQQESLKNLSIMSKYTENLVKVVIPLRTTMILPAPVSGKMDKVSSSARKRSKTTILTFS